MEKLYRFLFNIMKTEEDGIFVCC